MNIDEEVTLSPYREAWEVQFEMERDALGQLFPGIPIEHIGSTSVPGMTAKPIVDIMMGVGEYPPPESMQAKIQALGYHNLGENDRTHGRLYFAKRGGGNCNVHVMRHEGKLWNENILFREYLRAHRDAAVEYVKVKQAILGGGVHTLLEYSKQKGDFISRIIARAYEERV